MASVLRLVFSDYSYVAIACIIFAGLAVPLLVISEYVFLEPYVVAHLPRDTELGFSLIMALSALSGLVMSMNVYRIRMLRGSSRRMGGGVFGTAIGRLPAHAAAAPSDSQ